MRRVIKRFRTKEGQKNKEETFDKVQQYEHEI
jgi:hypothetical protein